MTEPLLHYSSEIVTLHPRAYVQDWHKPIGLWVSVGDDWKRWCEGEEFGLSGLRVQHVVTLNDSVNILRLVGPEQIDEFTRQFISAEPHGYHPRIDWAAVAKQWQGIIIAPYCYERRLTQHTGWYYGWDCASGCIWDLSAIASIELQAENAAAA